MHPDVLFHELEDLLRRLGVTLRHEKLATTAPWVKGGLYRAKGKAYCIVDTGAPVSENNEVLRDALRQLNLEGIYMKPVVREFIGSAEESAEARRKEKKKGEAGPPGSEV